jgi:hypothetical protein
MADFRMHFEDHDYDEAAPTIEALVARYGDWLLARDPGEESNPFDLQLMLDWKLGYGDGRFDIWRRSEVEQFLLEWCPRKVSMPAQWSIPMVQRVADAFLFLDDQGLLSSDGDDAGTLADFARALGPQMQAAMSNPANFGMAKGLVAGAGADFGSDLTPDSIQRIMDDFNELPYEQRKAITDPHIRQPEPTPTIGPVVMPSDDMVRRSAAEAPVLHQFKALADFFKAPGRRLTAKGNIRLADAGELSGILGTEPLEEVVGQRTFKKHSSEDMPDLDHWQWWAREVGALRVQKGRMVAVEAWQKRAVNDPVSEARKAYEVLQRFGVYSSYRRMGLFPIGRFVDETDTAVLMMLLVSSGPLQFEDLTSKIAVIRKAAGFQFVMANPELEANIMNDAIDDMLTVLERAGVIVQDDSGFEHRHYRLRRVSGTVALTPFGTLMAVEQARRSGYVVEILDAPSDLTAQRLTELAAAEELEVEAWLSLVAQWVDVQADRVAAVRDLCDELTENERIFVVLATDLPDSLADDFATVFRHRLNTHPPHDVLAAIAYSWLTEVGRLGIDETDPQRDAVSELIILGFLASADPQGTIEEAAQEVPPEEFSAMVSQAASIMPPYVESLLEAIGRYYSDKVVAKNARRELLRVRSRLANLGSRDG